MDKEELINITVYEEKAYHFTDKEKAEAVAVLVDGEVVEYE